MSSDKSQSHLNSLRNYNNVSPGKDSSRSGKVLLNSIRTNKFNSIRIILPSIHINNNKIPKYKDKENEKKKIKDKDKENEKGPKNNLKHNKDNINDLANFTLNKNIKIIKSIYTNNNYSGNNLLKLNYNSNSSNNSNNNSYVNTLTTKHSLNINPLKSPKRIYIINKEHISINLVRSISPPHNNYLTEIKEEDTSHFKKETSSKLTFAKNSKALASITPCKDKIYYYMIMPGNNSELIQKCMEHRINWKQSITSKTSTLHHFTWQHISQGLDFTTLSKFPLLNQVVNHLEFHSAISNKLNLFLNLMKFCEKRNLEVFNFIPFTVIIQYDSPSFLSQYESFSEFFNKIKENLNFKIKQNLLIKSNPNIENNNIYRKYSSMFKLGIHNDKLGHKTSGFIPSSNYEGRNMWLVKAADLNRGRCIKIGDSLDEIKFIIKKFYEGIFKDFKESEKEGENLKESRDRDKDRDRDSDKKIKSNNTNNKNSNSNNKSKKKLTCNFRKYRTSCMLVQKYIERPLLYYGRKFDMRIWVLYTHKDSVFVFKEGHLKTSSLNYDINLTDSYIHLTNYSVQKNYKEFSKYECGNEVSFKNLQIFLNREFDGKVNIERDIFIKIKNLIRLTFHSVKDKINLNKRKFCFELFGFDFIIDKNLDVFLLEVNTNPGLEESSPLIKTLLPRMIDDALRLTIDDLYETIYSPEVDKYKVFYSSPYEVEGYTSNDNLWELVTDFSDYDDY